MIAQCLDERSEFGIVWLADDGLKEIGCTATSPRCSSERPTGA